MGCPVTVIPAFVGDQIVIQVSVLLGGLPYNLTGCTAFSSVKRNPGDPDSAALVSRMGIGTGIALTNLLQGQAQITLTPAQSAALPPGVPLSVDFRVVDATGKPFTTLVFTLLLSQPVTQSLS